jgi:PKD domain.
MEFGDGSTSTDMNPFHLYSDTGSYTVSLKVFNNTLQDSIIKQNYIHVRTANLLSTNESSSISYFPNPVKDKLTIWVNSVYKQKLSYQIKDLTGKTLINGQIETNKQQAIDFSTLSKGCYIVQFENEWVKKLSIIKL